MPAPTTTEDWWSIAGAEFCRRIEDDMRKQYRDRLLPWERPVAVGQIDWWRVHAYALDRLDELLPRVLPDRDLTYDDTYWRGRHDAQSHWITVSLLSGAWLDPAASKRGADLVSLVAHVYRVSPSQAAIRLGQWLQVEAIRHA